MWKMAVMVLLKQRSLMILYLMLLTLPLAVRKMTKSHLPKVRLSPFVALILRKLKENGDL